MDEPRRSMGVFGRLWAMTLAFILGLAYMAALTFFTDVAIPGELPGLLIGGLLGIAGANK